MNVAISRMKLAWVGLTLFVGSVGPFEVAFAAGAEDLPAVIQSRVQGLSQQNSGLYNKSYHFNSSWYRDRQSSDASLVMGALDFSNQLGNRVGMMTTFVQLGHGAGLGHAVLGGYTAAAEVSLTALAIFGVLGAGAWAADSVHHQLRRHFSGYMVLSAAELKKFWEQRQSQLPPFPGNLDQFRTILVNQILDQACTSLYRGKTHESTLSDLYDTNVNFRFIPKKSEIRVIESDPSGWLFGGMTRVKSTDGTRKVSYARVPGYDNTVVSKLACMPEVDNFMMSLKQRLADVRARGATGQLDGCRPQGVSDRNEAPYYSESTVNPIYQGGYPGSYQWGQSTSAGAR